MENRNPGGGFVVTRKKQKRKDSWVNACILWFPAAEIFLPFLRRDGMWMCVVLGCLHLLPKANKGDSHLGGVYTEILGSLSLLQPSCQALELLAAVFTLPVHCHMEAEVKLPACFPSQWERAGR